jgi:hypothetical protein
MKKWTKRKPSQYELRIERMLALAALVTQRKRPHAFS